MARKDMNIDFELEGVQKLFRNLRGIQQKVLDNMESIIKRAAEKIADDAGRLAPERTGRLSESIEIKRLEITKDKIRIGVGPVGEDVFYWYFVEYGTAKMSAQPYLRPAFDENKDAVKREIIKEINNIIQREARRGR